MPSTDASSSRAAKLANRACVLALNAERPNDPSLWHVSFLDKKRGVTTVTARDVQCPFHQEMIHPFQDPRSHLRQLHMRAIEQLYVAIRFLAVLTVKREQVIANFLDSRWWGQRILASIHTQMGTGHNQCINVCGLEALQQGRHVSNKYRVPSDHAFLSARHSR